MKNNLFILCLSPLLLLFISCKKESPVSIVGQWRSVSIYTMQDNGTYNWMPVNRYSQFYNFSTGGRFGSATDVPGPGGSYNYDQASQQLTLYFEADGYGTLPGARSLKVEMLDRDKLILSNSSSTNYKTEFTRIN